MVARWIVVFVAILLIVPAGASAQATPEASPENERSVLGAFDTPDHRVQFWAARVYNLEGASFTQPHWFYFAAVAFYSSQDAAEALEDVPQFIESTRPEIEFRDVGAGSIESPYIAATGEVDTGFIGYLAVTSGRFLIIGETAGNIVVPTEALLPFVDLISNRLDESIPLDWQALNRNYLPSIDDLPPGYSEVGAIAP